VPYKRRKITFAMSRGRRNILFVFAALLASVFAYLDRNAVHHKRHYPQTVSQATVSDVEKYNDKIFTVVKAVDGDTIDINIPDGEYKHTRIRLWGVDTPETKKPNTPIMYFGPEASEFTKELVLGKAVTIYLDEKQTRDKYDRLLAYVQLGDGRYLNEVLLSEGYAYADLRFKHGFYNKYKQLEASARRGKKGLWEKVTPQQMPQWKQRETMREK
jgi:micrococcal nuclease